MAIRYRKSRGSERKSRLWLVCLIVLAVLCAPFIAATASESAGDSAQQEHEEEQQHASLVETQAVASAGTGEAADPASPDPGGSADATSAVVANTSPVAVEAPADGPGEMETDNRPPVADAGGDSVASENETVVVDPGHVEPVDTDSEVVPASSDELRHGGEAGWLSMNGQSYCCMSIERSIIIVRA